MEEYMEFERSGIFELKNGRQKYSAWVPMDPFYAYEDKNQIYCTGLFEF